MSRTQYKFFIVTLWIHAVTWPVLLYYSFHWDIPIMVRILLWVFLIIPPHLGSGLFKSYNKYLEQFKE